MTKLEHEDVITEKYQGKDFKRHHQEYYERLQAVRDSGERDQWLAFYLRNVDTQSCH